MKPGAGDDPFGDEFDVDEQQDTEDDQEPEPTESDRQWESDASDLPIEIPHSGRRIPWIMQRDSVKDDRDGGVAQVTQTTESSRLFRDASRTLEDRFDDEDVYTLDIREAIWLAGMANLDDAEVVLEEWGYGFEEDQDR